MRVFKGQSLIEVLVAIGAMSLLMVSLLSLVVMSLKNSRVAKNRARAVSLAQEGVELMRSYRDYSFSALNSSVRSQAYQLSPNWTVTDGLSIDCDATNYEINDLFSRCVQVQADGSSGVNVVVSLYWLEGATVKQIDQLTKLSSWER